VFEGAYDVFALIINFLGKDWWPNHVTIGLFEAIKATCQALVRSLTSLMDKYGSKKKKLFMSKTKDLLSML
jgi:hypothetical protein